MLTTKGIVIFRQECHFASGGVVVENALGGRIDSLFCHCTLRGILSEYYDTRQRRRTSRGYRIDPMELPRAGQG